MFYVDVREHEAAVKRIRHWLDNGDRALACLVSASYFEWCITRFTYIFSKNPLEDVSKDDRIKRLSGPDKYASFFKDELSNFELEIADVIKNWKRIVVPEKTHVARNRWGQASKEDKLKYAILTRHEVVHGRSGTIDVEVATFAVNQFLEGINYLKTFAEAHNESLFRKLSRKRDPKNRRGKTLGYRPDEKLVEVLAFLKAKPQLDEQGKPTGLLTFDKRRLPRLTRIFEPSPIGTDLDLLQRRLRRAHFPCKLCNSYLKASESPEQLRSLFQNSPGISYQASEGEFDQGIEGPPLPSPLSASQAQS